MLNKPKSKNLFNIAPIPFFNITTMIIITYLKTLTLNLYNRIINVTYNTLIYLMIFTLLFIIAIISLNWLNSLTIDFLNEIINSLYILIEMNSKDHIIIGNSNIVKDYFDITKPKFLSLNMDSSNAGSSNAGPSNAGPSNAGSSYGGSSIAGPSNTGSSSAGPSNTGGLKRKVPMAGTSNIPLYNKRPLIPPVEVPKSKYPLVSRPNTFRILDTNPFSTDVPGLSLTAPHIADLPHPTLPVGPMPIVTSLRFPDDFLSERNRVNVPFPKASDYLNVNLPKRPDYLNCHLHYPKPRVNDDPVYTTYEGKNYKDLTTPFSDMSMGSFMAFLEREMKFLIVANNHVVYLDRNNELATSRYAVCHAEFHDIYRRVWLAEQERKIRIAKGEYFSYVDRNNFSFRDHDVYMAGIEKNMNTGFYSVPMDAEEKKDPDYKAHEENKVKMRRGYDRKYSKKRPPV